MDAEGRDEFLRQLLQRSGWKVTAEVVRAARAELGIPRSTLFRLASRFLNTRRTSSLGVNGGAIPGQRGGAKPGQLGEIADMQRGPIGLLCMSAAKKFVGYVGEISPVSGSMIRSAAG